MCSSGRVTVSRPCLRSVLLGFDVLAISWFLSRFKWMQAASRCILVHHIDALNSERSPDSAQRNSGDAIPGTSAAPDFASLNPSYGAIPPTTDSPPSPPNPQSAAHCASPASPCEPARCRQSGYPENRQADPLADALHAVGQRPPQQVDQTAALGPRDVRRSFGQSVRESCPGAVLQASTQGLRRFRTR